MVVDLALPPTINPEEATLDAPLRRMVDAHYDAVWRALRRLGVPEVDAHDGAQQVFLVASRRLQEINEGGERRYLLGIALRVASEIRRAIRRRREVPIDAAVVEPLDGVAAARHHPEELLDNKRALAILGDCLHRMPQRLREAFVLFELEELSAPEVAQLLGVPIGTVASRVRRAREYVRNSFGARGAP